MLLSHVFFVANGMTFLWSWGERSSFFFTRTPCLENETQTFRISMPGGCRWGWLLGTCGWRCIFVQLPPQHWRPWSIFLEQPGSKARVQNLPLREHLVLVYRRATTEHHGPVSVLRKRTFKPISSLWKRRERCSQKSKRKEKYFPRIERTQE